MDPCYHPKVYNCQKEQPCDSGYECCSQNNPSGRPVFGLCVKSGTCDHARGICESGKKFSTNPTKEAFAVWAYEGYEDNRIRWDRIFLVLIALTIVFVVILKFSHRA